MATRGIIKDSIINYEIEFEVPANQPVSTLVIRDDLPVGLAYSITPAVSWFLPEATFTGAFAVTSGDVSMTVDNKPITVNRLQVSITDSKVLSVTNDTTYGLNIPAVVVDPDILIKTQSVTNSFYMYWTLKSNTTPTVGDELTDWEKGQPIDHENETVDDFYPYSFKLRGDAISITNTSTGDTTPYYTTADFYTLNSLQTANSASQFNYSLDFTLANNLTVTTATDTLRLFVLKNQTYLPLTSPSDYKIKQVDKTYNLSLTLSDAIRGQYIELYAPFGLKPVISATEFNDLGQLHISNPLHLNLNEGTKTVASVSAFTDVLVNAVPEIPVIKFTSKFLN